MLLAFISDLISILNSFKLAFRLLFSDFNSLKPVSYTHLDVYKRQESETLKIDSERVSEK